MMSQNFSSENVQKMAIVFYNVLVTLSLYWQAPLFLQDKVPVQQGLSHKWNRSFAGNDGNICLHFSQQNFWHGAMLSQ